VHVLAESLGHFEVLVHTVHDELVDSGLDVAVNPLGKPLRELTEVDIGFLEGSAGLLVLSILPLPPLLTDWAAGHGVPLVKAGLAEHCGCDAVSWHQDYSFRALTRSLLERGYRSVVCYAPQALVEGIPFFAERQHGYEHAMRQAGLQPRPFLAPPGYLFPRNPCAEFRRLLDGTESPTALIALSGGTPTTQLLARLPAWGYVPGVNFSVSGLIEAGEHEENKLVRSEFLLAIEEPWDQVGHVAARRLVQRVGGDVAPASVSYVAGEVVQVNEY
jgi:DNA-binding LacI/PurR family transcriptional regulator